MFSELLSILKKLSLIINIKSIINKSKNWAKQLTNKIMKITKIHIFFVLLILSSCKKTDEVIPNQIVIGTWRFQTMTGNVEIGGKNISLWQNTDIGLSANRITFREDGTGEFDGRPITYKVTGNVLSIVKDGKNLSMNVNVADGVFNISIDENGWKENIAIFNNFNPSNSKITKLSQSLVFKSLQAILTSNGTPECITTNYKITTPQNRFNYTYNYDDENKVTNVSTSITNLTTNSTGTTSTYYQEDKSNLGSETSPYVIAFTNNMMGSKYFCDLNGRVLRVEIFPQTTSSNFPASIVYYEYDKDGYNVKRTTKGQNNLTGELTGLNSIFENEFLNGDLVKTYLTTYNGTTVTIPRYLTTEFVRNTIPIKSKFVNSYNFGTLTKNYLGKVTSYKTDGTINLSSSYTVEYLLDSKGYLQTQTISFLDGTKQVSDGYIYRCQ
jgi:hypothetical protein